MSTFELDPDLVAILTRLRVILNSSQCSDLAGTSLRTDDLHDLTCYVIHRLLSTIPGLSSNSETLRYALAIYMFTIHGPTYYSHAAILQHLTTQLQRYLQSVTPSDMNSSLLIWCLSVGMSASFGMKAREWFLDKASTVVELLGIRTWDEVEGCLQDIFTLDGKSEAMFHGVWGQVGLRWWAGSIWHIQEAFMLGNARMSQDLGNRNLDLTSRRSPAEGATQFKHRTRDGRSHEFGYVGGQDPEHRLAEHGLEPSCTGDDLISKAALSLVEYRYGIYGFEFTLTTSLANPIVPPDRQRRWISV